MFQNWLLQRVTYHPRNCITYRPEKKGHVNNCTLRFF